MPRYEITAYILRRLTEPFPKLETQLVPQPQVLYVLWCDHIVMGRAFIGTVQLECPVGHGLQHIADIHVWEWRSRCQTPRCTYARWCGLSRRLAEQLANGHKRSKPFHDVGVEYARNGVAAKVLEKMRRDGIILCAKSRVRCSSRMWLH